MAVKGQPGEHLATAKQLLELLQQDVNNPSSEPQLRATAAVAHSVLAVAEQIGLLRAAKLRGED